MGLVTQHQLSTFSSPVNGTTPIDANTVRGNDNTIKTSYNAHDADSTIHLQSGAASARPAQGTAGQTWLATDVGGVFLSLDNGSAWVDINYIRTTATSLPANVLASSLTSVGVLAAPHMTSPVIDSGGLTISSGTLTAGPLTVGAVTATSAITTVNDVQGFLVQNTAAASVLLLGTTKAWVGSGSVTDARIGAYANLSFSAGGSNTAFLTIASAGGVTIASGLTVSAGGITVSAGGFDVTNGSARMLLGSGTLRINGIGTVTGVAAGATTGYITVNVDGTDRRLYFV